MLRILNLARIIDGDPVLNLEQAIAALPKDKMLGGTVNDILQHSIGAGDRVADTLDKARKGRNFIAHEGLAAGALWTLRVQTIIDRIERFRSAVTDLVAGDNIVSAWCYEIEEKSPAPTLFMQSYPDMVDRWVFTDLDHLPNTMDPAEDQTWSLLKEMAYQAAIRERASTNSRRSVI